MPADNGDDADERGVTVEHLKQAADWYATLGDAAVSDQERAAWRAWLAGSPAHGRAWQHIEAVSRKFMPLRETSAGGAAAAAGVAAARRSLATRRR
ncbi:DUF4880 domain-containing protein, partial [Achromobacter sp.]